MDPARVRDLKRELRARARRIEADPAGAAAALARLEALEAWAEARTVALFAARAAEPPADALADALSARGVSVAWPRIERRRIVLRRCGRERLAPGYRGIREPPADAPEVPPGGVDVFVVPGVLFDRRGARLGHGQGHYDRLLSGARSDSLRIGFCFEARIVDELPVDAWDVRMHRVVTESGVIAGTGPCR